MRHTIWLLLISITGLRLVSGWSLSLTPNEDRLQNKRSGDNFLVVCKVKDFDGAASDVKIEWYCDGKLIPRFGSTMTIERTYSNQLMINRPKISDGGKYTCRADIHGEEQEVSAKISFVDPPKFVNRKEEQHPEEGTRAEIVCEVDGTDQLDVFWQFNGATLDGTSQRGYEFSENNQILYIPHFNGKKDDGIYNCNAAQYSSFETLSINVTGYERPTITVFDVPKEDRGIEGHTIELKCGAVGKPKPTYKWFFEDDEVPIARSDKHDVGEEGLLIIESLNSEDAGAYKCIANNSVGSNERSFDLSVFLKPRVDLKSEHVVKDGEDIEIICIYQGEGHVTAKFTAGSLEFLVEAENKSIEDEDEDMVETVTTDDSDGSSDEKQIFSETDAVALITSVEHENVNIKSDNEEQTELKKWKRFADDVQSERISVRIEENKLILMIKKISLEDAGDYTCSVSNDAGTTNKITQVGIIHPPTLRHYTGPHIRSFEGNSVSIYCDVSAIPFPKWNWLKEGKEVEANGASIRIDTQSSSTKLTLENFKDSDNFGVYTCRADNGVGQLEKQIEVIKIMKPETPVGMDCKKIIYPNYGKCSFDTSLYADEHHRPQTMEVLLAKLEDMESDYNWDDAEKIIVHFENETLIPNLAASTQYVVKVRAVNEAGSSEYTDEISLETTDPWAPQAPSSVSMECSDYCMVSWQAPNDHGSTVLQYRISVQEMQMTKHEPSKDATITNLESSSKNEDTSISEEIGSNDDINSETSRTSSIEEDNDDHLKPTHKYEDKTIKSGELLYSAEILPTDKPTSAESLEYSVEKVPYGSPLVLEVDASEHQLKLTGIKPHSYYKIAVAAINSVGQGEIAEIEHQTDESPTRSENENGISFIIFSILLGVIVVFFFVDLICFLTNRCGVISCICLNICGKNSGAKQRDLEAGKGGAENSRLLGTSGSR